MKKRFLLIVPLALILIGGLAACGDNGDEVIATVGDEEIMESEWQDTVDQMSMQYEQFGIDLDSEEGAQYRVMIEEQALESLIQQAALVQVAKSEGIDVSEETLDEELETFIGQYPSEDDFHAALEENGYTEDDFREMLKEEMIVEQFIDQQIDDVEVDQEDIEERYEQYVGEAEAQGEEPEPFEEIEDQLEEQVVQEQEQEQIQVIVEDVLDQVEIERHVELG